MLNVLKYIKHFKTLAVRLRLTFQFTYAQYCKVLHFLVYFRFWGIFVETNFFVILFSYFYIAIVHSVVN